MQKSSRIKVDKDVVEEITDYILSQVRVYTNSTEDFFIMPPLGAGPYLDGTIKVVILPDKYRGNSVAEFQPSSQTIAINLPLLKENFQGKDLRRVVYKAISHELVHVYQYYYTVLKQQKMNVNTDQYAGLPPKKVRTPKYNQHMNENILYHRLDDLEFYPRLEDTINAMEFTLQDNPHIGPLHLTSYVLGGKRLRVKSEFLKEPIEWIKVLKEHAPRKYREVEKKLKKHFSSRVEKRADFYREVSPPDSLSSMSTGTPSGKSDSPKGDDSSSLPTGDTARNIGRPGPDSPNLKTKNLDRSESYGRKPAEGFDGGYVHDSGSGSARVIPYDSGFTNNSSPMRNAGLIKPEKHLIDKVSEIAQGALARYILNEEKKGGAIFSRDEVDSLEWSYEDFDYLHLAIKRGESDLEDVTFRFESTLGMLKDLKRKIVDPQEKSILNDTIDLIKDLDPKDVFENTKENKGDLRLIAWGLNTLHEYTKSKTQKKMVYDHSRDFVEEVRSKLSDHREIGDKNWKIFDESLSFPIIVSVRFMPNPSNPASYGWRGTEHNIFFNFSTKKETWGAFEFDRVRDSARHELVHLMQKEIAIKKNIRHPKTDALIETGLPFSKYDPKYRQHMKEKGRELKKQYAREGLNMNEISIHALDDIEFYSRLLDEVEKFKRFNKNPTNKEIRKALEGQFFKSLKRFKPKSWNKAVGIFVDAVKPSMKKKAARPIRIDKAKIKKLSDEAIKYIVEIAKKSKEEKLSEALKKRTMNGVIYLGTIMEGETPININLMVKKTHEAGAYIYNTDRNLHKIEIYLDDLDIGVLTNKIKFEYIAEPKLIKGIYSTLIHEVTHAVERIRYLKHEDDLLFLGIGSKGSRIDKSKIKTRKDYVKALKVYYNNPKEVKAHLQQIADEVEQYLIKTHGGITKESIKSNFLGLKLGGISETWKKVASYLTPKNQKYIKKAVLTYLMENING